MIVANPLSPNNCAAATGNRDLSSNDESVNHNPMPRMKSFTYINQLPANPSVKVSRQIQELNAPAGGRTANSECHY